MTADDLRERLIAAELATKRFVAADGYPAFGVNTNEQAADEALSVFAEHVASNATVERVARAQYDADRVFPVWDEATPDTQNAYRAAARAGLAALAAALGAEGEAGDG